MFEHVLERKTLLFSSVFVWLLDKGELKPDLEKGEETLILKCV